MKWGGGDQAGEGASRVRRIASHGAALLQRENPANAKTPPVHEAYPPPGRCSPYGWEDRTIYPNDAPRAWWTCARPVTERSAAPCLNLNEWIDAMPDRGSELTAWTTPPGCLSPTRSAQGPRGGNALLRRPGGGRVRRSPQDLRTQRTSAIGNSPVPGSCTNSPEGDRGCRTLRPAACRPASCVATFRLSGPGIQAPQSVGLDRPNRVVNYAYDDG